MKFTLAHLTSAMSTVAPVELVLCRRDTASCAGRNLRIATVLKEAVMTDKLMPWELAKKHRAIADSAEAEERANNWYTGSDRASIRKEVATLRWFAGLFDNSLSNLADALDEEAKELERRAKALDMPGYVRTIGKADALRDVAKRLRGGK